ncbi:MAG: DUF2207 domain-containing protein [Dokdonella sp.]
MSALTARLSILLWALLGTLLLPSQVQAQERILDYDVHVVVDADASLLVTETITVRAEGQQIRRGIYRDFPTRYRDRAGNRIVVELQVLGVQRDGQAEPWFVEKRANGVRINTGNDDFLDVPATYTYTLRYRSTRQMGYFSDHDELYWNAIGTGWIFPIEHASVKIELPEAVPVAEMKAEAYTGAQGSKDQNYSATLTGPGQAAWQLTRPLRPAEGMTVVLSFPKGIVSQPSLIKRAFWLLRDNSGALVALIGLIIVLVMCVRRWYDIGRDPRKGVIIARYEPTPGFSPAALRFLYRSRYENRCFTAEMLSAAMAGWIRIHGEDKKAGIDYWRLERLRPLDEAEEPQRAVLQALFPDGKTGLMLSNKSASLLTAAQTTLHQALLQRMQPEFINFNRRSILMPAMVAIGSAALGFWINGESFSFLLIALCALMLVTLVFFARLVEAPTPAGRKLLDEIEGLRLYLSVAERDELKNLPGPDQPPVLDAQRYEALLPYAVALDVEEAWTKKFTLAVGVAAAAAAASGMAWYRGGSINDAGAFSRALGSSLNSSIASSSTPPGSSSGSGGGGSSGGGGGGGGGGGR